MANSTDKLKGKTVGRKQSSTKMKASAKIRRANSKRTQTSTERMKGRYAGTDKQGRVTTKPRTAAETRVKTKQITAKAKMAAKTKGAPKDLGPRKSSGVSGTKTKRKMAKTLAKRAGGKALGVVGAAATVASDRKASEKAARRKAFSKATKTPMST